MIKWNRLTSSICCDIKHNGFFRFVYYVDTGVLHVLYDKDMSNYGTLQDRDIFHLNTELKSKDLEKFVLFYTANYGELYEYSKSLE